MSFVEFATREVELAGLCDADSAYDGMLGTAILELVDVFAKQGHSGLSAALVSSAFYELAQYKPLTPLTYGPDEWGEVGTDLWQNKRNPSVFSEDRGATHYSVEDKDK